MPRSSGKDFSTLLAILLPAGTAGALLLNWAVGSLYDKQAAEQQKSGGAQNNCQGTVCYHDGFLVLFVLSAAMGLVGMVLIWEQNRLQREKAKRVTSSDSHFVSH